MAVAWSYDTGEEGGLQTSPLIVGGTLYGLTPTQKVFALDAATGNELWKFALGVVGSQPDRGLAYWSDGQDKRILVGVMNFLYALDASTGQPIPGFAKQGRIDLREDLGRTPATAQSIDLTSPGIVYRDLIIVGGPRISHAFAKELGYDAGFGPGSTATTVASYIAQELVARKEAGA